MARNRQGSGIRVAGIVDALTGLDADVVVILYRPVPAGVSQQPADAGWPEQLASADPAGGFCDKKVV